MTSVEPPRFWPGVRTIVRDRVFIAVTPRFIPNLQRSLIKSNAKLACELCKLISEIFIGQWHYQRHLSHIISRLIDEPNCEANGLQRSTVIK